ncbi:hypothetical protein SE91_12750 [Bradyrhizobium sp. DOA1]|nr:hypothetical protein SE91_12750 [Bradyrhizobium sp. DOA1]
MDSDRRSKIEVLLRILATSQTEVQMLLGAEQVSFDSRSRASKETEPGRGSHGAIKHLENAVLALQEAMDEMEIAAGINWVG